MEYKPKIIEMTKKIYSLTIYSSYFFISEVQKDDWIQYGFLKNTIHEAFILESDFTLIMPS